MKLRTNYSSFLQSQYLHNAKQLNSKTIYLTLFILLTQFISASSIAQNQINYSPALYPLVPYTDEKVFSADINADGHLDIILYKSSSGLVTALKHNANNNANDMQFGSPFSVSIGSEILIDVKDINQDSYADLITYKVNANNVELYCYLSNGQAFALPVLLSNSLQNANYQFGTFDMDNDGDFDIYALDKDNSLFYCGIVNNLTVTFSQGLNIPFIPANAPVHIFSGHFCYDPLNVNTIDLCYVVETPNGNTSDYYFQVLKNNNGTSLSLDFNKTDNNVSPNRQFFAGKFTTDIFSDIAMYAPGSANANIPGYINVLNNVAGTMFAVSPNNWQDGLTPPNNASFLVDAGNYSSYNSYDDMLLLETSATAVPADIGNSYKDINTGNNISFALSQLGIAPCNANPIAPNLSSDFHVVQGDFNSDINGITDIVLYNPTDHILKVGILMTPTLEGYCWPQSAAPNHPIDFFISGTPSSGTIDFYQYESRDNMIIETLWASAPITITSQTTNSNVVQNGCGWNSTYSFNIPGNWPSGYYAAKVKNNFCTETSINFIVKADPNNQSTKKLLLLANTNTWAAYNTYTNSNQAGSKYGYNNVSKYQEYSLMRPVSNNNIASNDNTGGSRAELWIYTWLKDNGYDPDVITDIDLHLNTLNINSYDYLVMGTHPEYWTGKMYDNAKIFQEQGAGGNGGNLICLGGNAVFEVVDLELNGPNPKLIAYPYAPAGANALTATPQNNTQYPFQYPGPGPQVGGLQTSSPFLNPVDYYHDRFDYFLESYNFGAPGQPVVNKRSIDLIGTHYMNLAAYAPGGINTNASYTKANIVTPFFNGVVGVNGTIGYDGYSTHNGVVASGGLAAGWECDRYTAAVAPVNNFPGTPASPLDVPFVAPSIYASDILVLAASTTNLYSDPVELTLPDASKLFLPNGMNNSEIIYVRPTCTGPNKHGFVFTAGSICFGGSLVWNYDIQNNVYNNDLSRLLINVLEHTNFDVNVKNVTCSGGNTGSITITQPTLYAANSITYSLSGNSPNTTGIFSNLAAGTYQLTISIPNGNLPITLCREYTVGDATTGNFCCSPDAQNLIANTPNLILHSAPTATNLLQLYGNGSNTISNKTFYIDDILTVDADITFNNCILWFTPTGTIQVQGPYTLDVNTSTLQASCDWWGGIEANAPQQKVKLENNSIIKNAITGIDASNNALVEITNSHFVDNQAAGLLMTDITDPNYAGYVYGSSFDASTPIPLLPNALKVGIDLQNVAKMQIGDYTDEGKGNTFTHVRRGIGIWQGNLPMISNIGIYNNQFDEIKETFYTNVLYPEAYVINNTYNLGFGAAIYAYNGGAPFSNAINLDIRNVNAAVNTLAFTNCDKGIVSVHSSVTSENLYMDNVPMGICNYSLIANTSYIANHNKLYNTYIGMQFAGEKLNSEAKDNTIECTLYPNGVSASNVLGADYIWPKGIDVSYLVNTGSNSFDISDDNHITIPHYAGTGISLENAGAMVTVKDNTVDLGSTDASDNIVCNGATTLAGIASYTALGAHIVRNDVNGNTAGANLGNANSRVDACGILINKGEQQKIGCNSINNTRFGIMGWNENNIGLNNNLLVQGNTVFSSDAGWVFRHLANEGTLGEVGDPNNDNNNPFISLNTPAKVFKYCLGLTPGLEIYTTTINQFTESLSENINTQANDCPYQINSNPGATLFNINAACPTLQIIAGSATTISLSDAIAIATNTKQYIDFPVLAHWYDSKKLYEYLRQNPSVKNSNDTLLDFFDAITNEAIAQEQNADQKLQVLISSFAGISPAVLEGLWIDATTQNELINDTELHDANEQRINSIYLRMVRLGMDSLLQDDKEFIATLAPQCPYTAGSAVYKARTLNKFLNPGSMYDDLKICNQVGVYKQGNTQQGDNGNSSTSLISLEGQILSKLKPTYESVQLKINDFILYPNPTSDLVNIRYHTNSETENRIELYDVTGRKIMTVKFPGGELKTTIDLGDLVSGAYTFKYFVAHHMIKSGKNY